MNFLPLLTPKWSTWHFFHMLLAPSTVPEPAPIWTLPPSPPASFQVWLKQHHLPRSNSPHSAPFSELFLHSPRFAPKCRIDENSFIYGGHARCSIRVSMCRKYREYHSPSLNPALPKCPPPQSHVQTGSAPSTRAQEGLQGEGKESTEPCSHFWSGQADRRKGRVLG